MQDEEYIGNDFIQTFLLEEYKKKNLTEYIKMPGIYFEINSLLGKIFILSESSGITIVNTNFYNSKKSIDFYFNIIFCNINLPYIYLFDKINIGENTNYYIFKIKYAFSSFPINIINSNGSTPYLYSNKYLKNIIQNNENSIIQNYKFITCRHIDNSFKIHYVINNKGNKKIETYSFICEDFVMSCKTISSNLFVLGLKNGKLIKALIYEYESLKEKAKSIENNNDKFIITFDIYILGHKGSINMIEFDEKLNVIITGGDDNKLCIRKLYDFELLTCITIKSKFIITTAKISPMNFLYIMCYDKMENKSIIFGYTLYGLKFAKSPYFYYTNLDFTKNGNIISLINENEFNDIIILNGYNLSIITIEENDKNKGKYLALKKNIKEAKWMNYVYFHNNFGEEKIISYIDKNKENFYFKSLEANNISYFE